MTREDRISIETPDIDFDELMLQEYPGRIFEKNRKVRKRGDSKLFCYYGLKQNEFNEFISKYKGKFAYKTHQFLGFPNEIDAMKGVSIN
jgi:hypothetical protein